MKKLAVITSGALPIPSVKGGGTETLIQFFIDGNEKNPKFDIDIYTIFDQKAVNKSKDYRYSSFVFLHYLKIYDKIMRFINRILYTINRRTIQYPIIPFRDFYHLNMCKVLKKKKYDVVLVENDLMFVPYIAKVCRQKIVFHTHYNDVSEENRMIDKKIYKKIYNHIKKNITVSEYIYNSVYSVIGNKIKYEVVNNCVNINSFKNKINENEIVLIKKKYGIPLESVVIVYSGRITEEKGAMKLLQAYEKVCVSKICLVYVGGIFYSSDCEDEFLLNLKKRASLCEKPVVFTGYISYDKMPYFWKIADIAVVPTYGVEEASGLVAIEAMATGKPVIVSDSGALPENVMEECGIIVPRSSNFVENFANAISFLANNKDIREKKGRKAVEHVQKFSIDSYILKMMNALDL